MVQPGDLGWIEIFHSLPSWKRCFIVFKKDDGEWVPNANYELVSAEHIRHGFRVFRIKARKLEYFLTNGSKSNWDNNNGSSYHIGMPGRYVCGQGFFSRVGESDADECERFLKSSNIEVIYSSPDVTKKMYALSRVEGGEWTPSPGDKMQKLPNGDWLATINGRTAEVAFTDGDEFWDSNMSKNYLIGSPGKWIIGNGEVNICKEPESGLEPPSKSTAVFV